jgi:cellulose synthase/poly-beta-1,6-N-acetylglucosamine synthase-like glycosyltransferase
METYINSTQQDRHISNSKMLSPDNGSYLKRALVTKRFVNLQVLTLVFICSLLYLAINTWQLQGKPVYVVVLLDSLLFFLVWNKVYQILYDLKLMLFFNDSYDFNVDVPAEMEYPPISFIIPSYQEPFQVAKMTFDSVINASYRGRKEIIVVDNSKDTLASDFIQFKKYVEEFPVLHPAANVSTRFIYNDRRDTLKPGNLDLAEQYIEEGAFVVILDVDSTLPAKSHLLEKAVTEFITDGKLGFLQFTMKATNNHFNDLAQSVAASQDLHRLRLTCRSYGGYKIFEGHNGMWRKTVLDKVGAWTDYYKGNIMITEDILKSAQVYSNGYYGKSLNIKTGEWVPCSLNALESMWMRWTYGTSQVLFKYFKELYSKHVSWIEKFDISYHVLHHFAHGLILPFAILLQLFMPGAVANMFIIAVYILPQLVAAVTIYVKSISKLNLPFAKKIAYLYSGLFLVDTFIMSTQLKSTFNFLAGVPQGWKVTEKGVENSSKWKELFISKSFHIIVAGICFITSALSWIFHYNMHFAGLVNVFLLSFMGINLLLCILFFGKEGQKEHNNVASATIDKETDEEAQLFNLEVGSLAS